MSKPRALRLGAGTHGLPVSIIVDGEVVQGTLGESVAVTLLAVGRRRLRGSPRLGGPRGLFCAMGVCQECVVWIDGRAVTACTTPVREGLRISTGTAWRAE